MANLEIEIGAVTSGLNKSLKAAESRLTAFSKKAQSIGKNLSLAVTAPLVGLAAVGVRNFNKQAQAIGQVEVALKSTGNAADRTSDQLQKTASELQNISLFGDEEILRGVTAQLLTFTNISGEAFDRTQKAALDLATRLGGDLQSASIQLGKALNDPVANLSALSRSGIQFSEEQKEVIKSLAQTNRLSEAQAVILDELEKQYGGSAEAASKLGTGPLTQLGNQFGDLLEDVGKVVVDGLNPLIKRVGDAITFLQGLSDGTKRTIVIIGGLVAAIGPLLVAVGTLGLALPAIKAGALAVSAAFTPLVIKIIAVTAAVAGLAIIAKGLIDSWDTVTAFFSQLWDKVKIIFINGITSVLKSFNKLTSVIGLDFKDTIDGLEAESERIKDVLDSKPVVTFGDVFREIGSNIKATFTGIKDNITSAMSDSKDSINQTATALSSLGGGGLARPTATAIDGAPEVGLGAIGPDVSKIGKIVIPPPVTSPFLDKLNAFNDEISAILTGGVERTIGDFAFSIGEALGSGANVVESIGATLLNGIAQIANQLGQAAIGIGIAMISIKKAFSNPFTAIAAGAALIALAGFISSQVPKITQGASGGGAGGVTGGAGQSFTGSGSNNALVDSFGALEITGESKIQGTDIIISYEKAQRANGR